MAVEASSHMAVCSHLCVLYVHVYVRARVCACVRICVCVLACAMVCRSEDEPGVLFTFSSPL